MAPPLRSAMMPDRERKKRSKKMVSLSLFSPNGLSPSGYGDLF